MALMAAEELGVPPKACAPQVADTESVGYNDVTGGSRVTFATGMAVIQAALDIIAQMKQRAAATWGIDEELVDWQDGQAIPKPGVNADVKSLTLAQIAASSGRTGGPLLGRASLERTRAGPGFSHQHCDVRGRSGNRQGRRPALHGDPGCRQGDPSQLRRRSDAGRSGAGHRLGAQRGVHLRSNGVMRNASFLDYRMPVASTCR